MHVHIGGDFDNDLDPDVYLTAFPGDLNWLMVNDGEGLFGTEDENGNEPMNDLQVDATCWAANWLDVDNNGWEDLHVANSYSVFTNYPAILEMFPDEPDAFSTIRMVNLPLLKSLVSNGKYPVLSPRRRVITTAMVSQISFRIV